MVLNRFLKFWQEPTFHLLLILGFCFFLNCGGLLNRRENSTAKWPPAYGPLLIITVPGNSEVVCVIEQDVFSSFEFWRFERKKRHFNKLFLFWDVRVLQLYCFSLIYFTVLVTGFCYIVQADLNSCSFCLSFLRAGIACFHPAWLSTIYLSQRDWSLSK